MTPPLCACGCQQQVNRRRDGSYRTWARRGCNVRQRHKGHRITEACADALLTWKSAQQRARYAYLGTIVRELYARQVTPDAAVRDLVQVEQRAYQRGVAVGQRRASQKGD